MVIGRKLASACVTNGNSQTRETHSELHWLKSMAGYENLAAIDGKCSMKGEMLKALLVRIEGWHPARQLRCWSVVHSPPTS